MPRTKPDIIPNILDADRLVSAGRVAARGVDSRRTGISREVAKLAATGRMGVGIHGHPQREGPLSGCG